MHDRMKRLLDVSDGQDSAATATGILYLVEGEGDS